MGKEPVVMCQGMRYEPYSKLSLARRRRGSPPPDRRGIRAGSRHAQLTGGIFDLLDDLHARYGSHDLRELFRGHANQPGALGQAIQTWIQYDEIRGPRQPKLTDFLETQYNTQNHCNYVPDPTPRGECRASRPPVGQLDACHVSPRRQYSEYPDVATANEGYLRHSPQGPRFSNTPSRELLFPGPPNSPCITSQTYPHPESATAPCGLSSQFRPWFIPKPGHLWEAIQPQGEEDDYWGEPSPPLTASRPPQGPLYTSPNQSPTPDTRPDSRVADAPPLGSLLRVMRGVAAPPLVSLPPSKPSAVRGSPNWSDKPVVSGHNEQGCTSPRSSEESYHAAFWETAGWTPGDGYQGFWDDGPRIPPYLKGKGRARLRDPNEGGETPKEQDSSGWRPPQPGDPPYGIPVLASTVPQVYIEPVFPEILIKVEPQDEDPVLEGRQDVNGQHEHEQTPPQPESQPEPRRSARIKAMKDTAPPNAKTPAKSTGRKRAVRKK